MNNFGIKKIVSCIICIFLLQTTIIGNITFAASSSGSVETKNENLDWIGIQSTHAYAEKSEVEFGENIVIYYYFDDGPHSVRIDVYRNGNFFNSFNRYTGNFSDMFEFKSNQYSEDGTYRFVITPMDIDNGDRYSASVSVNVFQHRIIFIPGIMGTELYSGNKKIWMPPDNFPQVTLVNEYIKKLAMNESGRSIDINVVHGEPLSTYYQSFESYFKKEHFKVVNYGYDWRLDIVENVKELKNVIDKEVKSKHSSSKIYIVAHSMGGLLATEYIKEGYGKNIDKLVTMGTPYLGAPVALYLFTTGYVAIDNGPLAAAVTRQAFIDSMKNIYSAYQLLPSENYFSYNNETYVNKKTYIGFPGAWFGKTKTEALNYTDTKKILKNTSWSNDSMIDRSETFHNNLNILNNLNSVDSYYIVGDGIDTIGEVTLHDKLHTIEKLSYIKGDGTVPKISATLGGKLNSNKTYYVRANHTSLASNRSVQAQVLNILNGKPNDLANGISRSPLRVASVSLQSEGPVELHIYDSVGNHTGVGEKYFEEQIPYSSFYMDGENNFASLESDNYTVTLKGTSYGHFVYTLTWINEDEVEEKTIRFDAIDVTPQTIMTSQTNRNGQIILNIDDDGDGVIDHVLSPSVELDREDILDETEPTITSRVDGVKGVNEWYGKDVYYNIIGVDNESGVYKSFYDLNESGYKEYITPIPLPDTGIYYFKSFVRDKNRNDSEILIETVKVDTTNPTKPTMTIVPLKWTNQFVSITLSDSQDADSGFQKYQYKIGTHGEWKDYTTPIIIDTEGLHNVYARAVDNVFNLSDEVTGEAKVDKTKPTTPDGFEILSYNYNQVKISWLPSTDNVEVTSYDVYQDSEFVGSTTETEFTFNNLVSDRSYTFTIVARDEATNSSDDGVFVVRTPKSLVGIGTSHTLQVRSDGTVWSWGYNIMGQLGDGTTTPKTTAVKVPGLTGAISVAAGIEHSVALKSDGTVWSWGSNVYGQLGDGSNTNSLTPVQVKNLTGIIAIAASGYNSYALKSDGTVWSWGQNNTGQLGDSTTTNRNTPVQVLGVSGVSELAAGSGYAYALKTDGTVWGWGNNSNYRIPGSTGSSTTKAILMTGLTNIASIATSNGLNYGIAVKKDGSVGVWGRNYPTITPVSGLSGIQSIAGGSSNYAVAGDGSVWNWTNSTPVQVAGLSDIHAVAVGTNYTVASQADGSVLAWGTVNQYGQLGDGTTVAHSTPALVQTNTAPQVTLTYPLGSQDAPEESKVSNPSIRWTQEDAALTNFSAYQVQVLDASGAVVVDSGEVKQAVTAAANAWTVTTPLPTGEAFQVQVRVNDEHLWSEWSKIGWLKYSEVTLESIPNQVNVKINENKVFTTGEEITVTLSVYGSDNLLDTNFTGLHTVTISEYDILSGISSSIFENIEPSNTASIIVNVEFQNGVAIVPFSLLSSGTKLLSFYLDGNKVADKMQVEVQPAEKEPIENYSMLINQLPRHIDNNVYWRLRSMVVS